MKKGKFVNPLLGNGHEIIGGTGVSGDRAFKGIKVLDPLGGKSSSPTGRRTMSVGRSSSVTGVNPCSPIGKSRKTKRPI